MIGLSKSNTHQLIDLVTQTLADSDLDVSPPVRASKVHALIRDFSGHSDPYRESKQRSTEHALSLLPQLRKIISTADNSLDMALRLAIAGNIIDLGVATEYDLQANIERVIQQPLSIDHTHSLYSAMGKASKILYLADNAGETVFDRLLIEQLPVPVTYVVKGGPAINDATREDALQAGIDNVATLIDNGAAILGTLLDQCSGEFLQHFHSAEVIIAKGMANYESLAGSRNHLFCLLQVKCPEVARNLDAEIGDLVVKEEKEEKPFLLNA